MTLSYWSWWNTPPPPLLLHHTSLIPVLSCCQSARWVCYSILLLLYWSVCLPWYITQMELLVSKSGQIAFVDPADHHCVGHQCGTPQRCLTSTDNEFDFCSFSALQGWCLKVNFEIPHKMFSRFIWNTWRPWRMHGQLLFVATTMLLCHFIFFTE